MFFAWYKSSTLQLFTKISINSKTQHDKRSMRINSNKKTKKVNVNEKLHLSTINGEKVVITFCGNASESTYIC